MKKHILTSLVAAAALIAGSPAFAQDGACDEVRFVQVNWTGLRAQTETAAWMLEQIGYETDVVTTSVAISFESLAGNDRDVSFGLWLPTQRSMISGYLAEGTVDMIGKVMPNATYTLAVPTYVWEAGVKSFADLDQYKEKFGGTIYGIEAGNDGNQIVLDMIADDAYGLGDWELLPSSEPGMLAAVQRATSRDEWVVWLGWAPHPMNVNLDMKFLAGGAQYWGPNKGAANVYTITAEGYTWKCRNVGQFIENYEYTVDHASTLMVNILNQDMDYVEAGKTLIKNHPELLREWFGHGGARITGPVMTADGSKEALPVVAKALGVADELGL